MGTIYILLDHDDGVGYCRNCGMRVFELPLAVKSHLLSVKHYDSRYAAGTISSKESTQPYIIHGLGGLDDENIPHVRGNTRIQDIVAHRKQQLERLKAIR